MLWNSLNAVGFFVVFFSAVTISQPEEKPVCYWAFEEASGNVAIDSAAGHNLALEGIQHVEGAIGKGLLFKGAASKASAPMAPSLQSPAAVTLEAWARPDQIPPGSEGIGIVNIANCLIRITRGTPSFHVFTTKWGPVYASSSVQTGQWHHFVGTYDGTEMRIYVNGERSGTVERKGCIGQTKAPLVVGRQVNPFIGVIDEVKIFHRCLSEDEVKAAFEKAASQLGKPLETYSGGTCDIPAPLARLAGDRIVGCPATEQVGESPLVVRSSIPVPFAMPNGGHEGINEHEWRLGEGLGSTCMQVWPPPGPGEEWEALTRALTVGRPKGVKVLLPLPMHPKGMDAVWSRIVPHSDSVAGVVLCNGMPMDPSSPLQSWRPTSPIDEWGEACKRARICLGADKLLLLGRLSLFGDKAIETLERTAAEAAGSVDGICVWVHLNAAPEARLEPVLIQACEIAERHGLTLWLDASGWPQTDASLRNAYFLRLMAVCFAARVRLTWWPDARTPGAFLDENVNPTSAYHAAQAWQSIVSSSTKPPLLSGKQVRRFTWQDAVGRSQVAWWRVDDEVDRITFRKLKLPEDALVVDPMHARLLECPADGSVPVCAWPLVARGRRR